MKPPSSRMQRTLIDEICLLEKSEDARTWTEPQVLLYLRKFSTPKLDQIRTELSRTPTSALLLQLKGSEALDDALDDNPDDWSLAHDAKLSVSVAAAVLAFSDEIDARIPARQR